MIQNHQQWEEVLLIFELTLIIEYTTNSKITQDTTVWLMSLVLPKSPTIPKGTQNYPRRNMMEVLMVHCQSGTRKDQLEWRDDLFRASLGSLSLFLKWGMAQQGIEGLSETSGCQTAHHVTWDDTARLQNYWQNLRVERCEGGIKPFNHCSIINRGPRGRTSVCPYTIPHFKRLPPVD